MNSSLRPAIPDPLPKSIRLIVLILIIVLAACDPFQKPETETRRIDPAAGAKALAAKGQHDEAADAYLRVAEANLLLWSQVSAEVALAMNEPARALADLDRAPRITEQQAAANVLRLRGEALFRVGQPVAGTADLVEREIWLENARAIADNQLLLWHFFQNWGSGLSPDDAKKIDDPILAGWLELGYIAWSRRASPNAMSTALLSWQISNASHPANGMLIPEILSDLRSTRQFPVQVALLLPLTGRQQTSAEAIRDGFIGAHFNAADRNESPAIRIYDVNGLGSAEAYRRAVTDGADFIVGPLLKKSVQQLATAGITAPTLALNFLPDSQPVPPGLYQFSLSPEDEARQAARRAIATGQFRALVLAPNNSWGRRIFTSFDTEFHGLGGQIIDYIYYNPVAPDFSTGIQKILLINESYARKERLSANLGIELEFEPRRRADIDLIFLAANANIGKLIRPQLKFHYAGGIPTYATSAIYQEGSRNNEDLNGIMFPDLPWIIMPDGQAAEVRETLGRHWPTRAETRSRLYAMGFDAYHLIPMLYGNLDNGNRELQGMTGILYMDTDGRIYRRLPWAKISRGQVVPMEPLPAVDGGDTSVSLLAE
jgi:outer membrane PBP1 activator LpoA protein